MWFLELLFTNEQCYLISMPFLITSSYVRTGHRTAQKADVWRVSPLSEQIQLQIGLHLPNSGSQRGIWDQGSY